MKVAVVGLGYFGYRLAVDLAREGALVTAIDRDPNLVARIADDVVHAVTLDATDEGLLARQGVGEMDVLVVAIGENREAAILVTAHGLELGVPRVIARSTSPTQRMILSRLGASEVINPEESAAEQLASRLLSPSLLEKLPLYGDWTVVRVQAPSSFVGQSLVQLDLRARYEITVLGMIPPGPDGQARLSPGGEARIQPGDHLVLLGRDPSFRELGLV